MSDIAVIHEYIDVFPETEPLSNCYLAEVKIHDIVFPSAEHAYQALKFYNRKRGWDIDILIEILDAATGPAAKNIAHKYEELMVVSDQTEKVELMLLVLMEKFRQNEDLMGILLATDGSFLLENAGTVDKTESFWGIAENGEGYNVVGSILMHLKEIFLKERL